MNKVLLVTLFWEEVLTNFLNFMDRIGQKKKSKVKVVLQTKS